ncbi:MAG: hypothetical protein KGO02_08220 [Alphaproteobacteria bacterium]|nr:hypothetical protein [Alphaproteobacteria bacterium]
MRTQVTQVLRGKPWARSSRTESPSALHGRRIVHLLSGVAMIGLLSLGAAHAGPPFITDDPVPTPLGQWEVYGFSAATQVDGDMGGTLVGTEINHGAAPGLMLHMVIPLAFDAASGQGLKGGPGDIELGAKYRFVDASEKDWWPQIATFPLIEVPVGNARRNLGGGRFREYLPIWMEKDFGRWTTYGGGGYWINPGPGNRNYWFVGWLLQRQVTDQLALRLPINR